ncbi:MAG: TolC family protein [Moritella sp.]|uniref:TolC family protein n=1 Tax=Moritella sp. TaxID=78556 RepID=UPI0029A18E63|nr:TolC family protein [Moritella sp.]MDX2322357.1 TolC family protein [Moritella sp.]
MRQIIYFILAVNLSGCSIFTPPIEIVADKLPKPAQWSTVHLHSDIKTSWQGITAYPQLTQYIQEALANNPQLITEQYNIDIAVALVKQTKAGQSPKIDAYLATGRQNNNQNTSNSNSINIDAAWEIDYLGKLDDLAKAAALDAKQAILNYKQRQSNTIALIGQQWFDLIFYQQQLALISKRQQNLQQNLDIIESGYDQGLKQPLDVYLARADLARAQAAKQENVETLKNAQRQLELSLGRYPAAHIRANGDLAFSAKPVPSGLPSELIQRRFDIQQVMLALTAENYRVAHAYKNRFPSLSLSLSGGSSSPELSNLLQPDSLVWSFFANASASIFDAGALTAKQAQQTAKTQQAAISVTEVTLQAFSEVETALATEVTLAKRELRQQDAEYYFSVAEQLAFEQYIAGLTDYITVLESQRSAFDAQTSLLSIKNTRIQNRIKLLLALGGDIPTSLTVNPEKELSRVNE